MARPFKCRRISYLPNVTYFKPAGIPMRELEEVSLSLEEAEAIRLKDLQGLDQEQAAEKMNVSRPTFQRMLVSARQKIAEVILNGKAMRIEGGNFEVSIRRFRCINGHEWDISAEASGNVLHQNCPVCNTYEMSPVSPPYAIFPQHGICCRRGSGWQRKNQNGGESSSLPQSGTGGELSPNG